MSHTEPSVQLLSACGISFPYVWPDIQGKPARSANTVFLSSHNHNQSIGTALIDKRRWNYSSSFFHTEGNFFIP